MRTFVPSLQVRSFDQCLPGGQADQRDRSGLFHGELLWLIRYGIFSYRNEFRESTDSILIRPRIDLVARLESPHSGSDSDHDPGEIIAQNERQAIRQNELELSISDFQIHRIYACRVDLDQYVIVVHLRLRHFAMPHSVVVSITIENECLHDVFLPGFSRKNLLSDVVGPS